VNFNYFVRATENIALPRSLSGGSAIDVDAEYTAHSVVSVIFKTVAMACSKTNNQASHLGEMNDPYQ
jgi:hypothetical protein